MIIHALIVISRSYRGQNPPVCIPWKKPIHKQGNRLTSLNLRFSRLRDKMLVFVGLVKECLQYGHSFRLAGVRHKFKNVHFASFRLHSESIFFFECLKKTLGIYDFQVSHANIHQIIHPFFFTSRSISAKVLSAKPRPQTQSRGNKFRGPCVILVKNVITPPNPPPPLLTIREYVQHVNKGNKFLQEP